VRTPEQWQAEFVWLSPRAFAERVGLVNDAGHPSEDLVRRIIRAGTSDALKPPRVKDVSRSGRARYRIHPDSVALYEAESLRRVEERVAS